MSLNWRQFELGVLLPVLDDMDATGSEVAIKLVGETIWHESDRLRALGQYSTGKNVFGPGLGIANIERPTWEWMLKSRIGGSYLLNAEYEELAWDLRLNVIACRVRYLLDSKPLPKNNLEARAMYWFKVYNASGVEERLEKFKKDAATIPWVTY